MNNTDEDVWPPPLPRLVELSREKAAELGNTFGSPGDDWDPILLIFCENGFGVAPLSSLLEAKLSGERLAACMAALCGPVRPAALVTIVSQWHARVPADDPETLERVMRLGTAAAPGRRERLSVRGCDASGSEEWVAEIFRYKDLPPQLGAWERWEPAGGARGRLAGALDRAFALATAGRAGKGR